MAERGVVVAMSGGVDSSVAALLLRDRGFAVTGLFLRSGAHARSPGRGCCSVEDAGDAARVADLLGIPFYALDFEAEFAGLVGSFVAEYAAGRTPNPCILCNRDLKFGRLLRYADAAGADLVATGHYGAVVRRDGRFAVRRARDREKDQSYVLFCLSQEQLARTVLPLSDLDKAEVRALARGAGLPTSEKAESQDVCFVPQEGYAALLRERGAGSPGRIVDEEGREVGRHEGVGYFTVGQRRGLGRAFGAPRYVTAIDAASGTVRIGPREALLRRSLVAAGWVGGSRREPSPGDVFTAEVAIRYRHRAARAQVEGRGGGRVRVTFEEPQSAVAPGQAAVAYEGEVVAGGGWIEGGGDEADRA